MYDSWNNLEIKPELQLSSIISELQNLEEKLNDIKATSKLNTPTRPVEFDYFQAQKLRKKKKKERGENPSPNCSQKNLYIILLKMAREI